MNIIVFLTKLDLKKAFKEALPAIFISITILSFNSGQYVNETVNNMQIINQVKVKKIKNQNIKKVNKKYKFIKEKIKTLNPNVEARKLTKLILNFSKKKKIEPLLLTSIINSESTFKINAKSDKGAKGLMQLIPTTALYISRLKKIELKNPEHIYEPKTNLKLGVSYFNYLLKKYQGNKKFALMAYNWGPGNLNKALKNKKNVIKPVQDYAEKIIARSDKWANEYKKVYL